MAGDQQPIEPAWRPADLAAALNRWNEELASARSEAQPVWVVAIDVPFGSIFRIVLAVIAAQCVVGLVGIAILFALGVI